MGNQYIVAKVSVVITADISNKYQLSHISSAVRIYVYISHFFSEAKYQP